MTEEEVYHIESVDDGEKAIWPWKTTGDDKYKEPKKDGYLFDGWKYDDKTYKPPYVEADNPFGPINENTDIKAQWDKLNVYADTNHTLISGTGDADSDLTQLIFWAESENGKIITDGLTIEDVTPADLDKINFEPKDETRESGNNGKNVKKLKALPNEINKTKYYRFKAKCGDMESSEIEIQQAGVDQTVLPDFDFLTFVYKWADGDDLDTATFVTGTKIGIVNGYYKNKTKNEYVPKTSYDNYSEEKKKNYEPATLEYYPVGYGCRGSSGIDPDYNSQVSTNPPLFNEISKYIKGGGDNMDSGNESALVNWKEICNRDFITQGITKIYCELYANWYNKKESGNCTASFQTWKTESGTGGMTLERDSSGKSTFKFIGTGDTRKKMEEPVTIEGNVYAFSSTNANKGKEMEYYSHVATLIYDIKTKNGLLVDRMNEGTTGRYIMSYATVNGETYNGRNSGTVEYKDVFVEKNPSEPYSINITELYNLINDTERKDVYIKEEDVKIEYCKWNDTPVQEGFGSFTIVKDSSNHVKEINVSIQNNTSGRDRECDVVFYGKYYSDDSVATQTIVMRHQFKQNA
jgi:hypothetical protein